MFLIFVWGGGKECGNYFPFQKRSFPRLLITRLFPTLCLSTLLSYGNWNDLPLPLPKNVSCVSSITTFVGQNFTPWFAGIVSILYFFKKQKLCTEI